MNIPKLNEKGRNYLEDSWHELDTWGMLRLLDLLKDVFLIKEKKKEKKIDKGVRAKDGGLVLMVWRALVRVPVL